MRDFIHWLFSENNSSLKIGLFDEFHFLYLFLIFGTFLGLTFIFKNRSEKARERVVKIFAYLTIGLYVADFLIMPLSDSYSGISVSCASSLMWMCYPGSALGGQPPFSYIIFQTFMYHGFLFCWGALNLSLKQVSLKISKIWKEFVGILLILVWAWFGNTVYDGSQNWFFIESSIFPFLPDKAMPFAVVFSVFGVCLVIYGIYYLVILISGLIKKQKSKKQPREAK